MFRDDIEYRPAINYTPQLEYEPVYREEESNPSTLPSEVVDACAVKASDLYVEVQSIIEAVAALLDSICQKVTRTIGGYTVTDYIRALTEGDVDIIQVFLTNNDTSLRGSIEIEFIPILLSLQQELADIQHFLKKEFFLSLPSSASADEMSRYEEELMQAWKEGNYNKLDLYYRSQVLFCTWERIENIKNYLHDIENVFQYTEDTLFAGNASEGVEKLTSLSAEEKDKAITAIASFFADVTREFVVRRANGDKLNLLAVKRYLFDEYRRLKKIITGSTFVENFLTEELSSSPLHNVVDCLVEALEKAESDLEGRLLDMARINVMDRMDRENIIALATRKQQLRYLYKILSEQ